MKNLIILMGCFTLLWGTPALAGEKLLTDDQMDSIAAGTSEDGVSQAISGAAVSNHVDSASAQNGLDFGDNHAANVVNAPSLVVDNSVDASQNVDSKNRKLMLKDYVQQNARAVNIVNSMEGKVGIGVNAHYTSGGSISSLSQTNIITNSN